MYYQYAKLFFSVCQSSKYSFEISYLNLLDYVFRIILLESVMPGNLFVLGGAQLLLYFSPLSPISVLQSLSIEGQPFVLKRNCMGAMQNLLYTFFYKKLGSGHSTKSFLIQHEILSTKSFLIGFLFFGGRTINVITRTIVNMFLDF